MMRIAAQLYAGSRAIVSGYVSAGAQWIESLTIIDRNGDHVIDVDDHDWVVQLRKSAGDTSPDLTLETGGGGLTVTETNGTTVLSIDTDDHADLCGDYICDIASKASNGKIYHWAHGRLTFTNEPIVF